MPRILLRSTAVVVLFVGSGCADSASDGSGGSAGHGTEDGGAEEGADEEFDEGPGPDGLGCDESWEGWWDDEAADASRSPATVTPRPRVLREATDQRGRWHARAAVDARPVPETDAPVGGEDFRATLIGDDAIFTTGRHLAVSWCLGNIHPDPLGWGNTIKEEEDAINLEHYLLFRKEVERATRVWEHHSRMNFVHLTPLDDRRKTSGGSCDTALEHVWFRAQTPPCDAGAGLRGRTNAGAQNEFDPAAGSQQNLEGYDRYLCIAWQVLQAGKKTVPNLADHESGHIVGLDHEYVRWDQGDNPPSNCRDNFPFEPVPATSQLTPRDPWSVMGYPECWGSTGSTLASPSDWLGAYYLFNWTERRVRDMAPQTGGRDQRLWAGDERPGILWYLPFADHLLEWRFNIPQQDPLSFDVLEHCLDGAAPCSTVDLMGRWHPVMGQFSGASTALDVFMYGPNGTADLLLRNVGDGFESIAAPAPDRAIPVVGDFGLGGTTDQILWYRPGPASDPLWSFNPDGSHEIVPVDTDQDGWRIPLTGHFRSRTHWTDILWFDPRTLTLDTWVFNHDFSSMKSGPASTELLGLAEHTQYLPIVGNFDGDNRTDLFWYAPGTAPDWLWLSDSNQEAILFNSYEFAVDGDYHPIAGDFDGDGDDDLLWYRPAAELEGGLSYLWYFDGPNVEVRTFLIQGDYVPYVEDFDSDGCTDILWYDPVAPDNPSPVWRCLPAEKRFSCSPPMTTPKGVYPIGFATGAY